MYFSYSLIFFVTKLLLSELSESTQNITNHWILQPYQWKVSWLSGNDMETQLVLGFAKRLFFNLCNAQNPKPNSQTIRMLSPYRNISLFSLVFILIHNNTLPTCRNTQVGRFFFLYLDFFFLQQGKKLTSLYVNIPLIPLTVLTDGR